MRFRIPWRYFLYLACTASLCLNAFLVFKRHKLPSENAMEILVARQKIEEGEPFEGELFEAKAVDPKSLSDLFVAKHESLDYDGLMIAKRLTTGDMIQKKDLRNSYQTDSPASLIPRGNRLFTLPSVVTKQNEWIEKGAYVDVMGLLDIPGNGRVVKTLIQRARVVSLEPGLSFFCTPGEAEFLTFAAQHGEFVVSLRNPFDRTMVPDSGGITVNKFLSHKVIQDVLNGDDFKIISSTERRLKEEGEK